MAKKPENRMHMAAAYARYSTSLQQETSIAAQLRGIQEYCQRQSIALYPQPFIDEAYSGTNTNRPGFQALIEAATEGQFDTVVVYDISRGSRDVVDWFAFRKQMQDINVRVLSATNTIGDLDDPNSFLGELLTVGIGQHQVLQSRQKSIAGKKIRAERGLFCGGNAPFGYEVVDDKYSIKESEAKYVRLIFEMYANAHSYKEIMRALDSLGVKTRLGNSFTQTSLYDILTNERYAGKYIWFEHENRHMHKWVGRKNDEPITISDGVPRIIGQFTWEAVQTRLKDNRRIGYGKRANGREYLLSGLITCGKCGHTVSGVTTVSKHKEYKFYACLGKRDVHCCDMYNVKAERLEERVLYYLQHVILNPETIELTAKKFYDALTKNISTDTGDLRNELAGIKRKMDNIMRIVEDGDASPEFIIRHKELSAKAAELEKQIIERENVYVPTLEEIIAQMTHDSNLQLSDSKIAQKAVAKYVKRIVLTQQTVQIYYTPTYLNSGKCIKKWSSKVDDHKNAGSSGKERTPLTTKDLLQIEKVADTAIADGGFLFGGNLLIEIGIGEVTNVCKSR